MKNALEDQKETGTVSLKAMFTEAVYRKPTIIMLMLMAFQQLGGVNAIIMYLNDIFLAAGTDLDDGLQESGCIFAYMLRRGVVAQRLELKTLIHEVVGSNPSAVTSSVLPKLGGWMTAPT